MDSNIDQESERKQVILLFEDYVLRKRKGNLYRENDPIPKMIIKKYYSNIERASFDDILLSFRKRYISNENKLEQVHSRQEQIGMGIVYDHIQDFNDYKNFNIYSLLSIHAKLFSKTPYPEFGGKFRNYDVYLPGTGIATDTWSDIPGSIQSLYLPVNNLIKVGLSLSHDPDPNQLIDYIEQCIKLKCRIIQIHPFADGNGRSTRAFINLLFKIANIPPVYVTVEERYEYQKAMQEAIGENNYLNIQTFYYYKICDSIIELDIKRPKEVSQQKTKQRK